MRYATAPAASAPSRAISTAPLGRAYLPGRPLSSSSTFWKLMSSASDATYSRNSASTIARSSGQSASEMRMVIVTHRMSSRPSAARAGIHQATPGNARDGPRIDATRLPGWQSGLRVQALEELAVGLGVAQLVEQEVDRVHRAHRIEDAAQD